MKSKLKALLDDDSGVSPVIGVILMVAITVILAAVIGTFVLGLGDSLNQAPQAQLEIASSAGNSDLEISHNGGDSIVAGDLRITVDGGSAQTLDNAGAGYAAEDEFSVGETAQTSIGVSGGDRIRLIHVPSESVLLDATVGS
ncbi:MULTISPECIES: type IV pilin [Halolamina]|uniref:Flagellin N-terminal-like domain-containing protein n=1 Tax=Halolamina pelagica TaxID=699431 RepID=A0A1I5U847_9EURY|nr:MULTISPECIES: type IV pilin N-terminal domain-containing protein [Halolamina]NHX37179.1 type IV pilin [Halolamina sp. R1-12]SFP91469.1 flagellin N-terminal-like domain-containing protein [Halolamina pelagica]